MLQAEPSRHAPEVLPAESTASSVQAMANVTVNPIRFHIIDENGEGGAESFLQEEMSAHYRGGGSLLSVKQLGFDQLCKLRAVCSQRGCPFGAGMEGGDSFEEDFCVCSFICFKPMEAF